MMSASIVQLYVHHYRNVKQQECIFSSTWNIFVGANAQGKTNFLEAIHWIASAYPLRSVDRNAHCIMHGQEEAFLKARIEDQGPQSVEMLFTSRSRRMKINHTFVRPGHAWLEGLGVVAFTPDDLTMVKGSPQHRRRFIDRLVFSLEGIAHVERMRRWQQCLDSRNRLLREGSGRSSEMAAYTDAFIKASVDVWQARWKTLRRIEPIFKQAMKELSENHGVPSIALHTKQSVMDETNDISLISLEEEKCPYNEDMLRRALTLGFSHELQRNHTCVGPQNDDLKINLRNMPARHTASQGEIRSLVLALKLASLDALHAHEERTPVLLLDDIAGELDAERLGRFLQAIQRRTCQTFVTCTDAALVQLHGLIPSQDSLLFQVVDGALLRE